MKMGWLESSSSRRQFTPPCVVKQRETFIGDPILRRQCRDSNDKECLCSQRGQNGAQQPFYGVFLNRLCTDCPIGELQGKDPLEYLADECPDIASELEGQYTCTPGATVFPTLSPTFLSEDELPSETSSRLSLPSVALPSRTSTVNLIVPSTVSSTYSIFTASSDPATIVPQATTNSFPVSSAIIRPQGKSGLSTGAVVGIAISVAVPVILLILAVVFFFWRRRNHRKSGWQAERSLSPELYHENGVETEYGAQRNVKPIKSQALPSIMQEKHRASAHIIETREIYDNEEAIDSRAGLNTDLDVQEDDQDMFRAAEEKPVVRQVNSGYQHQHTRGKQGTKAASGVITRKEVPSRNSVPVIPSSRVHSPQPSSYNTHLRQESRSSSRVSGTLRGPVPDMYAYAGVTIDNEEELERLEEEERRIDEAIRESESRAQMRVEKEDIKARIQGLRDSM